MAKAPIKQRVNNLTLIPSDYQSTVISGLKRSFSRGQIVRDFLKDHRREEDWIKKDGTKSAKKRVFYRCSHCKQEFNSTQVQVDHIEPVVPLNIPAKHMSMAMFMQRLFVDSDKLQILCKQHHKEKSRQENAIRKEWLTKTKFIVYRTINRLNHKEYIGVHKCIDLDDGYIGSGNLLKLAIEKYGVEHFWREVLYCFDNAEDAYSKEKELVSAEYIAKTDTYNVTIGGVGGNTPNDSTIEKLRKKLICHQTGEIFLSVAEAAKKINISASSISKVLNNPNMPVKNLHFFTPDCYDPNMQVSFPISNSQRSLIHLNTMHTYVSIEQAAKDLNLNYKSLRNALLVKNEDNVYCLQEQYFLYDYEYDPSMVVEISDKKILCVELNKTFNTAVEAATFLKHKNPSHGGIAINKAIRNNTKAYKYTWKILETKRQLN